MNTTVTHRRPRRLRPRLRTRSHAPVLSGHGITGVEVRRSTRDPLIALSVSLADEFSDQVPAGTVIRSVARAREELLAAGVRAGLVVAVESMARAHLRTLAAPSDPGSGDSGSGDDVAPVTGRSSSGPAAPAEQHGAPR